jgi:hypothetical protein
MKDWIKWKGRKMSTETEIIDALTRRPGERYFQYIKRLKNNENARIRKLAALEDEMKNCIEDLPNQWSQLCRYAKAYGILIGEWREGIEEMNTEEIKVGDYVIYEDRRGCVNKINGDKALCRFFGYTKWLKIEDLVKTEKWKG